MGISVEHENKDIFTVTCKICSTTIQCNPDLLEELGWGILSGQDYTYICPHCVDAYPLLGDI